jgi:hypothetical protein
VEGCGLDASGLGSEPMVGYCEHDSEILGSVKGVEFLRCLPHGRICVSRKAKSFNPREKT